MCLKWLIRWHVKRKAKQVAEYELEKWIMAMNMKGKAVTEDAIKRIYENLYQMKLLRYEGMLKELGL